MVNPLITQDVCRRGKEKIMESDKNTGNCEVDDAMRCAECKQENIHVKEKEESGSNGFFFRFFLVFFITGSKRNKSR